MKIIPNQSLKAYNTFGIEALAKAFIAIQNETELAEVLRDNSDKKLFILGGGSNMLLTQDINALVIHINNKGITVVKEDDDFVWVKGNAGEVWHEFVLSFI
jgi:UDP-N-acetylmuramate dehydrogenase